MKLSSYGIYVLYYKLCKEIDERKALKSQFTYLNEGDLLVMDRGYYSEALLESLVSKKINVIFRMKLNSLMVQELIKKVKLQ